MKSKIRMNYLLGKLGGFRKVKSFIQKRCFWGIVNTEFCVDHAEFGGDIDFLSLLGKKLS